MTEEEKAARVKPVETVQKLLIAQAYSAGACVANLPVNPRIATTLLLGAAIAAAGDNNAVQALIRGMKAYLADHGEISPPGEALQ